MIKNHVFFLLVVLIFNSFVEGQTGPSITTINFLEFSEDDDDIPFPINPLFVQQNSIKEIYVYRELDIGGDQWYPLFEGVHYQFDKKGQLVKIISLGQADTIYIPTYDTVYTKIFTFQNGKISREFSKYRSQSITDVTYKYWADTFSIETYYSSFHESTGYILSRFQKGRLIDSFDSAQTYHYYYDYDSNDHLIKRSYVSNNYPSYNSTVIYAYDSLQRLVSVNSTGPYADRYQLRYTTEGWLEQLDRFERDDDDHNKEECSCTIIFSYGYEGRITSMLKTGCAVPYWQSQRLRFVYTYY